MLERLLGYADDCYQIVGRHGWPSPVGCILESEKESVGRAVSNRPPTCATIFLLFLQESAPIPSPALTHGPTLTLTPSPTAEPRWQRGQGISLVHGVQTARVSVRRGLSRSLSKRTPSLSSTSLCLRWALSEGCDWLLQNLGGLKIARSGERLERTRTGGTRR